MNHGPSLSIILPFSSTNPISLPSTLENIFSSTVITDFQKLSAKKNSHKSFTSSKKNHLKKNFSSFSYHSQPHFTSKHHPLAIIPPWSKRKDLDFLVFFSPTRKALNILFSELIILMRWRPLSLWTLSQNLLSTYLLGLISKPPKKEIKP